MEEGEEEGRAGRGGGGKGGGGGERRKRRGRTQQTPALGHTIGWLSPLLQVFEGPQVVRGGCGGPGAAPTPLLIQDSTVLLNQTT